MENVGDLLALGHEYHVAKVTKECRKFLMSAALDNQTAVKVLVLAQKYGLDDVRAKCCDHLVKVAEVDKLKNLDGFQDLDVNSIKSILLPQLEECQSCLRDVLPQLVGLMEFTIYLLTSGKNDPLSLKLCYEHYGHFGDSPTSKASEWRLRHCTTCQEMFKGIPCLSKYFQYPQYYKCGNSLYFNEQIVDVSCRAMNILGTP